MAPWAVSRQLWVVGVAEYECGLLELMNDLATDGLSCVLGVSLLVLILCEKQDVVDSQSRCACLRPGIALSQIRERQEGDSGDIVALLRWQTEGFQNLLRLLYSLQLMTLFSNFFITAGGLIVSQTRMSIAVSGSRAAHSSNALPN